jgi:hypothetical protein
MKFLLLAAFPMLCLSGLSQNIQFHYDFRHTTNPDLNPKNFPAFSFEYFKNTDTVGNGSFLLKINAQLDGTRNNTGQVFTQISQSLKFWKPKIYLSLSYSGGLGVTPSSYGFYIASSFGVGVSFPFRWNGAWIATALSFRYNAFNRPSYDPQLTFYFGKGFFNYGLFCAGSFVFWTQNKNQGNEDTRYLKGKKFAFFGDPQLWIKIKNGFSAGSRINVYYHLLTDDDQIQIYPTIGIKYQF